MTSEPLTTSTESAETGLLLTVLLLVILGTAGILLVL